ncbi:UNKNOWN [Stylonychia lemnae]|uniref:EamA domain-containing protein n=1 Tax=Stylonychia lemnae TaxID=5949 RepID=A0A077ZSY3_STYLE|nr:UNKNOWN [Stylonychia lemnae]|eukprot:CDW72664.1 UNKNOWN [Stylonychia lemnae]
MIQRNKTLENNKIPEKVPLQFEIQQDHQFDLILSKNRSTPQKNHFLAIFLGIQSALAFGIHNYIVTYAIRMRQHSSSIVYCEFLTFLIQPFLLHVYLAFRSFRKHGKIWIPQESQIVDKQTNKLKYICLFCVVIRGMISVWLNINIGIIAYYSKMADISPSVILSTVSLASFTTALAFFIFYKEKLSIQHLIGMGLILLCVVLISISKSFSTQIALIEDPISVLIPLFFAMLSCLTLTTSTLIIRKSQEHGYHILRFSLDQQIAAGVLFLGLFIYSWNTMEPYTWPQMILIQIAVLSITVAIISFNFAIQFGKGGIIMSMSQLQNLFQLIFEFMIEGRVPNYFEIMAITCALVGSITIGLAQK